MLLDSQHSELLEIISVGCTILKVQENKFHIKRSNKTDKASKLFSEKKTRIRSQLTSLHTTEICHTHKKMKKAVKEYC